MPRFPLLLSGLFVTPAHPVVATPVLRAPDGMEIHAPTIAAPKSLSKAALIAAAKTAPVPQRVQIGPTCGLYALGMVMDSWHAKDPQAPTVFVREEDSASPKQHNYPPTSPERMLGYAQGQGFTQLGEMFSAEKLAATAAHFGYQASLHEDVGLDRLYAILDKGHPALVAFDVDWNGNPGDSGGLRAHYAVIEGYLDLDGQRYVVAKHGWGVESDHVWRAADFEKAWRGMKQTEFYSKPQDGKLHAVPDGIALPKDGARHAIEKSLAAKIIEIVPAGEALVGGRVIGAPAVATRPGTIVGSPLAGSPLAASMAPK